MQTKTMEPAPPDPARLDALAAATREYATYSSTAFGLGYIAWGGLLVVAGLACLASPAWGPILVFTAAPAWFPLMRRARRHYQGRGEVRGEEQGMSARRARQNGLFGLVLVSGLFLLKIARHRADWAASQGAPASVAMAVAVACTLLAVVLAVAWARGYRDTYLPALVIFLWAMLVATDERFLPASRADAVLPTVLLFGTGLFLAVRGGHEHEAWKRLDRRLAHLRGAAR
jgi:hypothetical protein